MASDLTVPPFAGFALGKPASQRAKGSLRPGCLFPFGPSVVGRGPTGKRRLIRWPMSGHEPRSAAACERVRITGQGRGMASYHLSVKTIKRSAGRTATAAGAYRAGERIECHREGRVHDYTRKQGVEETFIVAPETAPAWAQDRSKLWNEAEASETRRNSVTAREWELALPSEISAEDRSQITRQFAEELVSRYGVAVDVAIHAPHREGDQRNHHAHILTSTRKLEAEGFTAKTRVLDSAKTGGVEIEQMRGVWAVLQNRALERAGEVERVDHRSLEAQREEALSQGNALKAEELDRDPEVKLGPAANAMERREMRAAERDGRDYKPVTERGSAVHAARQARALFAKMRERLELVRGTYGGEREAGRGRVSSGLAALKVVTEIERRGEGKQMDFKDRRDEIMGRSGKNDAPSKDQGYNYARERLNQITKGAERDGQATVHRLDGHNEPDMGNESNTQPRYPQAARREVQKPSLGERLKDLLKSSRNRSERGKNKEQDRGKTAPNDRQSGRDDDLGR